MTSRQFERMVETMYTGKAVGKSGSVSCPVLKGTFTVLVKALQRNVKDCYSFADGVIYRDDAAFAFIRVYHDGFSIRYVGMKEAIYFIMG